MASRAAVSASRALRLSLRADTFGDDVLAVLDALKLERPILVGHSPARVVKLPGANHYVYLSNEADVLREMRAFLGRLS